MANDGEDVELGNIQHPTVQLLLHSTKRQHNQFSPPSIRMIPRRVRDINPTSFDPRVVSIGPLHRNDENLLPFEQQKSIFLRDLLDSSPEHTLETCVHKVNASIDRIRACYEDGMKSYSDDEIAGMMVMDACFILELGYKLSEGGFDENIVLTAAMIYDLLLIENQIPFFVLQDIFEITYSRFTPITSVIELVFVLLQNVNIFESDLTIKNDDDNEEEEGQHDHMLGLMHKCYQPSYLPPSDFSNSTIHSAVELDRAGVSFKPYDQDPKWCMAIELEQPTIGCFSWHWPWAWGKPTLRMPVLCIHDDTELVFKNLIAYEQFSPQVRNYITSYAVAIDMLINDQEDVARLVESRVVVNSIGSNHDVATMINQICKESSLLDFFYPQQWQDLDTYYSGYWPRNLARLRRTYFNSPWTMIALFAGILLFLLTIIQTYFTINPL